MTIFIIFLEIMVRLCLEMRNILVNELKCGKSQRQLSRDFKIPRTTIQSLWNKYINTGNVIDKVKSGRPQKTSEREQRTLVILSKRQPMLPATDLMKGWKISNSISICTTRRVLRRYGLFGRCAARKPFLSNVHKKKRYAWCKAYLHWNIQQWRKVIFSDECKIELHSKRRQFVRRFVNQRFVPKNVSKTFKYGGRSFMVWGAINGEGQKVLIRCPDIMDSYGYQSVLEKGLSVIYDSENVFMQDGAPCHRSISTIKYIENKKVCLLSDWPAQSPDINIIENLWSILKSRVQKHNASSIDDLWRICQIEWEKISVEEISNLYNSIPRRLALVMKAKGFTSKY